MNQKLVAEYICELRKKRGFTQAKLGEILGVSDKAVSKWETGDGLPDVGILPSLALALNTTVDNILNGGPISLNRVLRTLGEKRDVFSIKLVLVSIVSGIAAYYSMKYTFSYLTMKMIVDQPLDDFGMINYELQKSLFNGFMPNIYLYLGLGIMAFSAIIYHYYKHEFNKQLEHDKLSFVFFEAVMRCIWIIPLIFGLGYIFIMSFRFMIPRDTMLVLAIVFFVYALSQFNKLLSDDSLRTTVKKQFEKLTSKLKSKQ